MKAIRPIFGMGATIVVALMAFAHAHSQASAQPDPQPHDGTAQYSDADAAAHGWRQGVDYTLRHDALVFVRLHAKVTGGRASALGKVTVAGLTRTVGAASVYRSHLNVVPPENVELPHSSFSMAVPAGATFRVEHTPDPSVDLEIHVFYFR